MAGLLGRKLGMTQVFDPEDGRVERVTVIEAGPCFVTAIRREERDGYDALQLAFGEVTEKKLNKPKLGHLKKAGVGNLKYLTEFRGDPGEAEVGNEVKVDAVFEKGQTVKVSGVSKGKGFAGTIKRHNFHRGPVSPRLAQRARARLDRRLGRSRARVQGHPRPRPDGQQAGDPARPRGRRRAAPTATCSWCAAPCRAPRAPSSRSGATPDGCARRSSSAAAPARSTWTPTSSAKASTARSCTRLCAPSLRHAGAGRIPPRRAARST